MIEERFCEQCGAQLRYDSRWGPKRWATVRFCSLSCRVLDRQPALRPCVQCGASFRPKAGSRVGRFCSKGCYYAAGAERNGPRVAQYKDQRMVTAHGHPIAPPSGVVAVARLVLYDKVGPGEHPCHWCAASVAWKTGLVEGALIADHLDWNRNNDDPANLVPSCHSCNGHRRRTGDAPLLQDDDLTMLWGGSRTRAVRRYCLVCDDAFLTIPAAVKKGRGLYCSRSCARRVRRATLPPNPNGGSE
jgi:hypothetical protein